MKPVIVLLATAFLTAPAFAADYPKADRPVADIVSPIWNSPEARDKAGETGQLVSALGLQPGMTVADIGAGSGYETLRLSPIVGPTGRILAEDVESAYLKALRETTKLLGNVTVIDGAPDDPRLPARSVDVAILIHMYHEVQTPYGLLARLAGAMKPGGRVAIVDLDRPTPQHGTPPALLKCELEAVGYAQTDIRQLDGGIGYLAVFSPPANPPPPESVRPCTNPGAK